MLRFSLAYFVELFFLFSLVRNKDHFYWYDPGVDHWFGSLQVLVLVNLLQNDYPNYFPYSKVVCPI